MVSAPREAKLCYWRRRRRGRRKRKRRRKRRFW